MRAVHRRDPQGAGAGGRAAVRRPPARAGSPAGGRRRRLLRRLPRRADPRLRRRRLALRPARSATSTRATSCAAPRGRCASPSDQGRSTESFGVLYGDSYLRIALAAVGGRLPRDRATGADDRLRNEGRWDRSQARLEGALVVRYDKGATTRRPRACTTSTTASACSTATRSLVRRPRRRRRRPRRHLPRPGAGGRAGRVRGRASASTRSARRRGCAELDGAPLGATRRGVRPTTGTRRASARTGRGSSCSSPRDESATPELSIVIPALNEELTISRLRRVVPGGAGRRRRAGRDPDRRQLDGPHAASSRSPPGRACCGCRSVASGRAYIDALPYIRGKWLLMGDADCTYDFRQLAPFVAKFREGYEYVMGSRWKGSIEKGAMPPLHQYLGTPVTTWILNRLYSSRVLRHPLRDARDHPGRARRMDLHSQSWEYASRDGAQVGPHGAAHDRGPGPVPQGQGGPESHHKREGWFSPWKAAWINLRAMFVYGADFFILRPGIVAPCSACC